eukprot:9733041-Alexandrium_andersonii.AAC.1
MPSRGVRWAWVLTAAILILLFPTPPSRSTAPRAKPIRKVGHGEMDRRKAILPGVRMRPVVTVFRQSQSSGVVMSWSIRLLTRQE